MANIGQLNKLVVIKEVPFGIYLDGENLGEILLPKKYVPNDTEINDIVEVFVYLDSTDRIIATTKLPRAKLGECAFLKVIDVNNFGAFLDWGLDKDLLVPVSLQLRPMEVGKSYLVFLKLDNLDRIVATSKINYFLDKSQVKFSLGEEVDILIAETTALGNKVIINNSHWGLVYYEDIFQTLSYGKKMRGFIKTIRDDGKIDVSLRKAGQDNILKLANHILMTLKKSDGFIALHDKSSPLDIKRAFGDSKKNFKRAIGELYKRGDISIQTDGIKLLK
jgi:uncharacterized protein